MDVDGLIERLRAFRWASDNAAHRSLVFGAANALATLRNERDEWRTACLGHGEKAAAAEKRAEAAEAQLAMLRDERDGWRARESETQEALQSIGELFGVCGGEPRVDGIRRVMIALQNHNRMQASIIRRSQAILTEYLCGPPRGLTQDQSMNALLALLDGPEQRAADEVSQIDPDRLREDRDHDPTNPFAPRAPIKRPIRLMTDAQRRAAGLDPNGGFDGPTGAD